MTTIVTRAGKGSELTFTEMDSNLTNLNNDKLENITNESIGDLSDVDISSLTDGYVLTYNSTSGNIELQAAQGGTGTALSTAIYAKATETIAKGAVVMFAGAQGDHVLIANADSTAPGFIDEWIVGVTSEALSTGDFTNVVAFGNIEGIDTDTPAWDAGTLLYLDNSTPGGLTSTKPTSPDHAILIAAVTQRHQNNGNILVRPSLGEHLGELHDVLIASESDGQYLTYNAASSVWQNTTLDTTDWDTAYSWGDHSTENYLKNLSEDTTPQLGANLDAQSNRITNLSDPISAQDAVTKSWAETNLSGGGGASAIDDLTDVDTTGKGDTNVLAWNATTSQWEPRKIPTEGYQLRYDATSTIPDNITSGDFRFNGILTNIYVSRYDVNGDDIWVGGLDSGAYYAMSTGEGGWFYWVVTGEVTTILDGPTNIIGYSIPVDYLSSFGASFPLNDNDVVFYNPIPVGQAGSDGVGIPAGGTAGQVLAKIDSTDYNTEWVTPEGGSGGGTDSGIGDFVVNQNVLSGDFVQVDATSGLNVIGGDLLQVIDSTQAPDGQNYNAVRANFSDTSSVDSYRVWTVGISSSTMKITVGDINPANNTIAWQSSTTLTPTNTPTENGLSAQMSPSGNFIAIMYVDNTGAGRLLLYSVSGYTLTLEAEALVDSSVQGTGSRSNYQLTWVPDNTDRFVIAYNTGSSGYCQAWQAASGSLTSGTSVLTVANAADYNLISFGSPTVAISFQSHYSQTRMYGWTLDSGLVLTKASQLWASSYVPWDSTSSVASLVVDPTPRGTSYLALLLYIDSTYNVRLTPFGLSNNGNLSNHQNNAYVLYEHGSAPNGSYQHIYSVTVINDSIQVCYTERSSTLDVEYPGDIVAQIFDLKPSLSPENWTATSLVGARRKDTSDVIRGDDLECRAAYRGGLCNVTSSSNTDLIVIPDIADLTTLRADKTVGVALESGSATDTVSCRFGGIFETSGLTPGVRYYVNAAGDLTTNSADTVIVGRSLSDTQLLMNGGDL